jgi:two-component system chemotaxis response regulator CheY
MKTPTKRQCIIADDVRASREMLASWLTEFGYECVLVGDGVAAMQSAEQCCPDLIITDIEMPRCNGLELLDSIRKHDDQKLSAIPMIVVSSLHDKQIVSVVSRFGADCVLTKPLEKLRVKQVVLALEIGGSSPDQLSHVHELPVGQLATAISPKLRRMAEDIGRE